MNATTLPRTFALIGVCLLLLTACTPFKPEEVNEVVIPTSLIASSTPLPTPTRISVTTEPNDTPLSLSPTENVIISSPIATVTTVATVIPASSPSPTATITPMTVIYLTPTAEWQRVQLNNAIFDIPVGWFEDFIPGAPFAQFINIERSSVPFPLGEGNRPRDRGLAYIGYDESPPSDIPDTGGEAVIVDNYPALISTFETGEGNTKDIIYGLSIYTPVYTHGLGIKCLTHHEISETQQQEFLAMCESIVRHWVETTDILE